jgi:D-glycerate 3-kinase
MNDRDWVQRFIEHEKLPTSFVSLADDFLVPFAKHLLPSIKDQRTRDTPIVIAIHGAQGTGKTTFAKFLAFYFGNFHGLNGTQISLDDFYLTRSERIRRASAIHPLILTRGVPGTHDVALAMSTISKLKRLKPAELLPLPSFDKAADDRKAKQDWPVAVGVQDFIIFEGWCVGSQAEPVSVLEAPINQLEEKEDPLAIWRTAVNKTLNEDYRELFSLNDILVFLKAPDFETVLQWRSEQEMKLGQNAGTDRSHIMLPDDIARIVQYLERITRHDLRELPKVADHVFAFDRAHQIVSRTDKRI